MKYKRIFFFMVIIAIITYSLSPTFAQVKTGWTHLRYDLNGSNYYPFPSTVKTDNKYNLNWTAAIGLSQPGRPILTGDVNGDGYLEIVHVVHSSMKIFNMAGNVLKQVTLGSKDCVLSFLADFNRDGVDDIFIQTANDPQMRIYIYDGNGNLLSTIAKSSSGDPDICAWAFLPNGKLIVSYKGRIVNNSRGLACWLYDFNTKQWSEKEIWYYSIGPAYSDVSIADADQDGKYEITLSTVASSLGDIGTGYNNNGTPTPDNQVYTVVVDEDGNEEFTLPYEGVKAFLYNYFVDFDHDGKYEILAVECHGQFMGSFPGTSKLHIIDYASRTLKEPFNGAENAHWSVAFADVNGDGIDEIIASNIQTGSFAKQYILDSNLNILKSADIGSYVTSINDINGDGKPEIVLKDESIIKILDNELNLLWSQPLGGKIYYAIFSDLDKNGRNELLVTADKLFNFEVEPIIFPDIEVNLDSIAFGNVLINNTKSSTLYIKNVGQGLLNVSNITNNDTVFTANHRSGTISTGNSLAITISFKPTSKDSFQDIFLIYSNDPDESPFPIPVSGNGVLEPHPSITLSDTSHDFGDVNISSYKSWQLIIGNKGDANLEIEHVECNNSVFKVNQTNFTLVPSDTKHVVIRFTPDNVKPESGVLTILSYDPKSPDTTINLFGNGVDSEPPVIANIIQHQERRVNSSCQVSATVTDNWKVQSAHLFYRKGGDANFQNVLMTTDQNNVYKAEIPASAMTFEGIEYFIRAKDGVEKITSGDTLTGELAFDNNMLTTSNTQNPYKNGYPRGKWYMLSVPAKLKNLTVSEVFNNETELGAYGEPNWRLFSYEDSDNNGVTNSYIEFDVNQPSSIFQFTSGKAFWLKANPNGNKIEIDVGAGHVLSLEPQTISLKPGWNQIGNPFAFPITFSPDDLSIVNQLYLPDGTGGYQLTTTMQPWTGYFTYVNGNNNVDLVLSSSLSKSLQKDYTESCEWVMNIATYCGDSKDEINYLGISQVSSDNYDIKDLPEPPAIGDHISLYFPHPNWQQRCKQYTSDFRLNMKDGQLWNFEVTTNQNSPEVTLNWEMIQAAQPDLKFILYDINRAQSMDMKFISQYSFSRMNEQAPSRFKIIVGSSHFIEGQLTEIQSLIPDRFRLFQNYPNPFNASTVIPFDISRTTNVKLILYNIQGEQIKVLINSIYKAGHHEITFSAPYLPSGLFFYKIEADGFVAVKKFIVLK